MSFPRCARGDPPPQLLSPRSIPETFLFKDVEYRLIGGDLSPEDPADLLLGLFAQRLPRHRHRCSNGGDLLVLGAVVLHVLTSLVPGPLYLGQTNSRTINDPSHENIA